MSGMHSADVRDTIRSSSGPVEASAVCWGCPRHVLPKFVGSRASRFGPSSPPMTPQDASLTRLKASRGRDHEWYNTPFGGPLIPSQRPQATKGDARVSPFNPTL
ncbi:hypothetical protein VTK26DRAFT_1698 [Humicola hyalothermophila]